MSIMNIVYVSINIVHYQLYPLLTDLYVLKHKVHSTNVSECHSDLSHDVSWEEEGD